MADGRQASGSRTGGYGHRAVLGVMLVAAVALSACQSAESGRQMQARRATPAATLVAPADATRPAPPPVPATQASFRFDQILGIPANRQDTLASAIASAAKARNLTLVRRSDPNAAYRVLGYLSAVGGDGGVTVSYVWDIVDARNNRLHRFTGTEIAGSADADPWSGVDNKTLTAIGGRTVEAIYAWVNRLPPPAAPSVQAYAPALPPG